MKKTIGQMIAELEAQIEQYREADRKIAYWKLLFDASSEKRQMEMIKELLKTSGFSAKEIKEMLPTEINK